MKAISKVSEIEVGDLADYLRIDELTTGDQSTFESLLNVAKAFIESYTGHTEAELDNYPDFVIVTLALCQDMYDNRTLYVDKSNLNKMVETILGMHSVNLL